MALISPIAAWKGDPRITSTGDWWAVVMVTLMFGLPTLWGAVFLIRYRIIADENGLTFQGFRRRRFVAWKDIEDFELRSPTQNEARPTDSSWGTAHLKIGEKWHRVTRIYAPYDAFLERVVREAKWSRSRTWQQSDLRDDGDWPKVFQYRDVSGWRFAAGFFLVVALLAPTQIPPLIEVWNFLAPWEKVALLARTVFFVGALPFAFILMSYLPIRTRRRYLNQKIVATHDGISLFKNSREIVARWDEIESYYLEALPGSCQPNLCVINAKGQRIEFVSGIEKTLGLKDLVQDRAKNASTSRWRHRFGADEDLLGDTASLWPDGNIGVGPKIHHYRTRSSRILLVFGFVVLALLAIGSVRGITERGYPHWPDILGISLMFGFILCTELLGLMGFLFASLQCEADGLRQFSRWGERFVPWNEVEKFFYDGHIFTLKGQHSTIRFSVFIADLQGLQDEIEARGGIKINKSSL